MRTSAIIRILIWSIVIFALVGILIGGLTFGSFFSHKTSNTANKAAVTEPATGIQYTPGELMVLTEKTNLYSSPNTDSPVYNTLDIGVEVEITKQEIINDTEWAFIVAPEFGWISLQPEEMPTPAAVSETAPSEETQAPALISVYESPRETAAPKASFEAGQNVTVTAQESIDGTAWAYITAPETGWVLAEDLNLPVEPAPSPDQLAEMDNKSRFDTDKITSISIEWVAGNIVIEPWDGDKILVSDTGSPDNEYNLMFKHKGKELQILFCQELQFDDFNFAIHFGHEASKDLLVQIPRNWNCQELEIDAASSNVVLTSQTIREVEINSASGTCRFDSCAIGDLDLDTASGDVEYTGTLNSLDFDAASASFRGVLTNVPNQIDMDSMSGDLDLTLPEDAGFTAKVDGIRSNFTSDFPTSHHNGRHVYGDGRCRIDVDAVSGNVSIRSHHPDAHH